MGYKFGRIFKTVHVSYLTHYYATESRAYAAY